MPLAERFWRHVEYQPAPDFLPDLGPCAIWTGAKQNGGYGKFGLGRGQATVIAHRLAWQLAHGEPSPLPLDHLCRVRGCVSVRHLEPVTTAENNRRAKAVITACPQEHEYTAENTGIKKDGSRYCRMCHRIRQRDRHRRLTLATAA